MTMTVADRPVSGTFCWVELATTDLSGSRRFYGDLLGWTITDVPGPMPYATAALRGSNTAGLMALPEQARQMGAPPRWLSYVAVDDIAATADRALDLGATVLVAPTAMGPGTFAVIEDPTKAVFGLWHGPESIGSFLTGEPGALGWSELTTTDTRAASGFYTQLFGWTAEVQSMPGLRYTVFRHGDRVVGGMAAMPEGMPGLPSHWAVYFVVADVDASFDTATAAGGAILMPLMTVPTVGRFGFLADPQGAAFALITFEARSA
jgi:uncharacterized protein